MTEQTFNDPPGWVRVDCTCYGPNPSCQHCEGTGKQPKRACARCAGTGKEGGRCPDCRGQGWREIDQRGRL